MATGAATYVNPAEQFAVTPQALAETDPLGAGGPPPLNALSLPSVPTTATMAGQIDPGVTSVASPTQLLTGTQQPTGSTASTTLPAITITAPAPSRLKPLTSADIDTTPDPYQAYINAPISLQRFQQGILAAENSKPWQVSSAGARSSWQVLPSTVSDPGFNIEPGDPNNLQDYNRVGQQYSSAMYSKYGPVLGAAAYNWGPKNVDMAVGAYGDPRKGQISYEDFVSKLPPTVQQYIHHVAGGQMALPGQAAGSTVTSAIDPGQTSNPLALQPAQSQADIQAQMKKYMAATAMASLLPQGFAYHPIDFDPFKRAYERGQTRVDPYRASGFETPRVVLGSGQGPSVTAISPAGVTPVTLRRRGS